MSAAPFHSDCSTQGGSLSTTNATMLLSLNVIASLEIHMVVSHSLTYSVGHFKGLLSYKLQIVLQIYMQLIMQVIMKV